MKLRIIREGHWQIAPIDYPNSMVKPTKGRMSFLLDPSDRDRFFKPKPRRRKKTKR